MDVSPRFPRSALLAALLVPLLLSGCGGNTAERRLVERAALAMGGGERITAVEALREEGDGRLHDLGKSSAPGAAPPSRSATEYEFSADFARGSWQTRRVSEREEGAEDPLPERRIEGLDGSVAWDVVDDEDPVRLPAHDVANRRLMLLHHPIGAMRAALARESRLSNLWRSGDGTLLDVVTRDGGRFTLYVDPVTFLPSRVRSLVYHPNLGDVVLETSFSSWEEADGLLLPALVITRLDGDVVSERRIIVRSPPGEPVAIAAPEAALRSRPDDSSAVGVEEVAPGVWRLTGDRIDSVVLEFDQFLALVEAPGSSARTVAMIHEARRIRPRKPLRYLINTHHHFDHSAGVRAAVSEGLTVITHERNRSFYEDIVRRPHSLASDALALNPRPLVLEPVSERLVLEDALRRVEIHPATSDPHASTMLMVYLADARMLIRPGGTPGTFLEGSPAAQRNREWLVRTIDSLGLDVAHLLPLRGRPLAMVELRRGTGLAADPATERRPEPPAGATTG
jgi:glyoxylase-like metal-dependent hydrolase (beta-lactamase superfamily II)